MHLKLFLYLVRIYILSACDDQVRPPGLYVKLSFSVNMTEVSSIKPAVTIKDALIACGIEIGVKYLRTFEPYTARFQCRNRLAIFVTYFHIVIPEYNADAFLRDIHAAAAESRIGYNLSESFCHPVADYNGNSPGGSPLISESEMGPPPKSRPLKLN